MKVTGQLHVHRFSQAKKRAKKPVFDQKQGLLVFLSFSVTLGLLFFYFLLLFLRFLVLFPLKGHLKAIHLNCENKLEFISLVINQKTHSIFLKMISLLFYFGRHMIRSPRNALLGL